MSDTDTLTIAGKTFTVTTPYVEGHALTANEAAALNQTRSENIRNNFAKFVKEATEAGSFDQDAFQAKLTEYDNAYQFGVRTGGGRRTSDPVESEALEIARGKVREAILKQGKQLKAYTAAQITELAKQVLAKYPEIRETARTVVSSRASIDIDLSGSSTEASAPAPKKAKGSAEEQA